MVKFFIYLNRHVFVMEFESSQVNEPSVFESSRFYCIAYVLSFYFLHLFFFLWPCFLIMALLGYPDIFRLTQVDARKGDGSSQQTRDPILPAAVYDPQPPDAPGNNLIHNVWKWTFKCVRPTKTQISLRIRAVWFKSSLSAWRNFTSSAIQKALSEESDQSARMRRLIWILAGRICSTVLLLALRLVYSDSVDPDQTPCLFTDFHTKPFCFLPILYTTSVQVTRTVRGCFMCNLVKFI